jgi:hypothetical protein
MSNLKGLMVFYVDVGQLAPTKAETFVDGMKEKMSDTIQKLKDNGIEPIFIPVRPNSHTRVEFVMTSDNDVKFDTARLEQ